MCGIGAELQLYSNVAMMVIGSIGFVAAGIYYKNDLKSIFKKEDENVIQ